MIEVASGEYGDVTKSLVKSWKIQEKRNELAEMEKDIRSSKSTTCDTSFAPPIVVTYIPGKCTSTTSSTESLLDAVSQSTQVNRNLKIGDQIFSGFRFLVS